MSARCMETSLNANAAAKLNTATETLLRTASGRQLYAKYNDSKTYDIYITVADFGEDSKHAGITIPNAEVSNSYGVSINKDSKINIRSQVDAETKRVLSNFKNTDFSKSKGRQISLVSISNEVLKREDQYVGAEIIYHELGSHIEINTVDADKDHELYGKTSVGLYTQKLLLGPYDEQIPNADGSDAKEIVPSGSPAGKMVKQSETLKKKEQKK